MNDNFTTQAGNFTSALQTDVDPRTGQFTVNFPLCSLVGNNLLGPNIDFTLGYNSLDKKNLGFGKGFSCGVSYFNRSSNMLQLSNGEKYKTYPGSDTVKNKKLNNFKFSYTNGSDDTEGYTITWKEGKKEKLTLVGEDTFIVTSILSPLGRLMSLSWNWSGEYPVLSEVRDETTLLCQFFDGIQPEMIVWPGTPDEYLIIFELLNDDQLEAVVRTGSGGEMLKWQFDYELNEIDSTLLLTGVTYPTGMTDRVLYSQHQGLRFPSESGIFSQLPVVVSYTRAPGGGQPDIVTHYTYTEQNFLGFNSNFGDWFDDNDYIYTTLTDYEYGSTATVTSGDLSMTTERVFNNYHLQVVEEVQRGDCRFRTEIAYYAVPFDFIDAQPPQFMLPAKKTEIWLDAKTRRTQETLTEYDTHGNPIVEISPDGTTTLTTWYTADGEAGCPAEPNGFVRFMKSQAIIPPDTDFPAPQRATQYTYRSLGTKDCIVQESESQYCNEILLQRRTTTYCSEHGSEFGRITELRDTSFDEVREYTSTLTFSTAVSNRELRQTTTFTGHDGLQNTSARVQSVFSGAILSETDTQGLTTEYTYDGLGRILSRTMCPGTDYESTTKWAYSFADGFVLTTETDPRGNAVRTGFDGSGRQIRRERYDADRSREWYEIHSAKYNVLGENIASNGSDWLIDARSSAAQMRLTSQYFYDGWGNTNSTLYSNGTAAMQHVNPILLTALRSQQGVQGNIIQSSGKILTHYDINGRPLCESFIDASENETGRRIYEYDGWGQLCRDVDEHKNVTQYTYDLRGRVASQSLPDGSTVTRTYAPYLGNDAVTSITVSGPDAQGNRHTWLLGTQTFDSLGRLVCSKGCGRTTTYAYDGASPVPSEVVTPSGDVLRYTSIPELGYVPRTVTADGIRQSFEYNPETGLQISAQEEGSVGLAQSWTVAGHLATETRHGVAGGDRRATHRWSLSGQPVGYTDVTGKTLNYIIDETGRVTGIRDDALSVSLTYDALGRPVSQQVRATGSSSQLDTDFTYDDFGRELSRTVSDSAGVTVKVTQCWRANGQLAQRVTLRDARPVRTETYRYDERNRLVGYSASGTLKLQDGYGHTVSAQVWHYDALNNLTTVVTTLEDGSTDTARYHYDNPDDPTQLTSLTHSHAAYPAILTLVYDANGRMIRDEAGRSLRYDVTGRLIAVSNSEGAEGNYGYDAMNRLVSQTIDGSDMRELYYRGDELVNEIMASQGNDSRLIKLGHQCLGMQDGNGLTLTAANQHESLLWSRHTDEDGQLCGWTSYGDGESPALLPGFNGERRDPMSGAYHLGNGYRAYNSVLMRFNCPDSLSPFGDGGINPYAYCEGDPLNRIDPTGHISWSGALGIGLGILGLIGAAFTGGASIAAAGGVMAAIYSASTTALVMGSLRVVSDVTAIASGAAEATNPEASGILGWVSLAAGVVGLATGGMQAASKGTQGLRNRLGNIQYTGLSGRGATSAAKTMAENQNQTVPRLTKLAGKALPDGIRQSNIFDNVALPTEVYAATHNGQRKIISQVLRSESDVMGKMNKILTLFPLYDELDISRKVLNEFYEAYEAFDVRTTLGKMTHPTGRTPLTTIARNAEGIPTLRWGFDHYTEKGSFFIFGNTERIIHPENEINKMRLEYLSFL